MTKKTIDTLVDDIYNLLSVDTDHKLVSQDNLDLLAENIKKNVVEAMTKRENKQGLRMSAIGRHPTYLYHKAQDSDPVDYKDKVPPRLQLRFLLGHIVEEVVLFYAKEAGHEVTREQEEIEVEGVLGHIDCFIDGELRDVKSCTTYGLNKFKGQNILTDDPFGYVGQLEGYAQGTKAKGGGFLAVDIQTGEIVDQAISQIDLNLASNKIKKIKEVIAKGEKPTEKCYEDEHVKKDKETGLPDETSNKRLNRNCTFCSFKFDCWENLRVFGYSTYPEYLTEVKKEPRVNEITDKIKAQHSITKKDRNDKKKK